jgi:hypothetical protein
MSEILGFKFDGDYYANTDRAFQRLLEDISAALDAEAFSDPALADATDDERQEAASMAFDGTHYQLDAWSNLVAIMQQSPYALDIQRIDSDTATAEDLEALEYSDY